MDDLSCSDTIDEWAIINAIQNTNAKMSMPEWNEITNAVMSLPTIQPEPAIPLSWIEKHIRVAKRSDNEFAKLVVGYISIMLKKWRGEQNEYRLIGSNAYLPGQIQKYDCTWCWTGWMSDVFCRICRPHSPNRRKVTGLNMSLLMAVNSTSVRGAV